MPRIPLPLVLLLTLAPCACVTPRQAMASHPWLEVKTKHFRLYSDSDAKHASASARDLERYRRAMLILWNPDAEPGDVNYAAVLRDRSELIELAGTDYAGYYASLGSQPMLSALVSSSDQIGLTPHQVLRHELAHLVTHMVVPAPPTWLTEGLSGYLETARVTPAGEVQLGAPNRNALSWLTNVGLMDLDRLWGWNPVDKRELGQYYAAAWALIHYLVSERPEQFAAFIRALASGRDAQGAWGDVFGSRKLSDSWQAVRDYAARNRWRLLTAPLPAMDESVAVRVLSEGERHAALGWLGLMSAKELGRERFAGYRRELDQGLKLDPGGPMVKDVAELKKRVDSMEQQLARQEAAEKAPAVCPDDVVAGEPLSRGAWAPREMVKAFGPHLMWKLDPSPRSIT